MAYEKLKAAMDGDVLVVTLSDPATLNAASLTMGRELTEVLGGVGAGPARAVVLTGEGRGFCSGADLNAGPGGGATDADGRPDVGAGLESLYNPLVTLIRDLPVPIVTAVNGAAAGIGCSFALLGDLIVAGESGYFLQAFRRIGLVPDGGSTWLLPRMVGRARAMEMALMGEKLPAAKALEWGLVNRVVPDAELMATALGLARSLAAGPASLGLIRRALWAGLENDWATQLAHEREAQRTAGRTEDFREGVAAFLAKRPAAFAGR